MTKQNVIIRLFDKNIYSIYSHSITGEKYYERCKL